MTGLKLLADQVDAKQMSRATAGHAASIGISGALSFACADLLAGIGGWRTAFLAASLSATAAWVMVAIIAPSRGRRPPPPADGTGLFNFLPVFRNRSAMAYALAYCVHTLEMSALRGWGVAFLAWVAGLTGAGVFAPTAVITALGLIGTAASIAGNEAAIRIGRRRLIMGAMVASILLAACIGYIGSTSYGVAVILLLIYGLVVWLDSSSLTAGAAGTADPARRGATLAVHSMLGYAGGFVGPLIVGWVLDGTGGMSRTGWTAAFLAIAVLMALALAAFAIIRPNELAGDRGTQR
jgi:predicted MFS family arabinose efflux permease